MTVSGIELLPSKAMYRPNFTGLTVIFVAACALIFVAHQMGVLR